MDDRSFYPADAARLMTRLRFLKRSRIITAHQLVLADHLVHQARRTRGTDETAPIALSLLQLHTGMARQTLVDGIARLEAFGVLRRVTGRVQIKGPCGGSVWRQLPNRYVIVPLRRESRPWADSRRSQATITTYRAAEAVTGGAKAAQEALAAITGRRMAAIHAAWHARYLPAG